MISYRSLVSHVSGFSDKNQAISLSNLGTKIKGNSKVWLVWPKRQSQKITEKILMQCLHLPCNATVIRDLPCDQTSVKDLLGVKIASVYELLTPSDEIMVFKEAYQIAGRWFQSPVVENILKWEGLRLGEMVEHVLPTFSFIEIVRLVEGVLKWLKLEHPDAVIMTNCSDRIVLVFRQIMAQEGIPVIFVHSNIFENYLKSLIDPVRRELLYQLLDLRDLLVRVIWSGLVHRYKCRRSRKRKTHGPLAIFVGFDRNHYKHMLPVAYELQRRQWRVSVLRGLAGRTIRATEGLGKSNVLMDTVDGYVTLSIWSKYRTAKRQIREIWKGLNNEGAFAPLFVYRGINLWPLIRQGLEYCFRIYLPNVVRYAELTKGIIRKESPCVFVFGDDCCFRGHAMIAAARQHDITTFVIQHGIIANPWAYVPYGDKMIVWGEHSRRVLVESGADKERLVCVGAPGLDSLFTIGNDEILLAQRRAAVCSELGIRDATELVLLLTSAVDDDEQRSFVDTVFQMAKDLSLENRFVVKLHPNETGRLQRQKALELGIKPLIVREVDLWGLVAASRVVITSLNSTAGIEALILRKPVIGLKKNEYSSIYENTNGLVFQVEDLQDLKNRIRQFLDEPFSPDRKSLEWFLGSMDGKAIIRASELIEIAAHRRNRLQDKSYAL